jgi:hypothetical protein
VEHLPIKTFCELLSEALLKPLLARKAASHAKTPSSKIRKATETPSGSKPSKKAKNSLESLFVTPLSKTHTSTMVNRAEKHLCTHIPIKIWSTDEANTMQSKSPNLSLAIGLLPSGTKAVRGYSTPFVLYWKANPENRQYLQRMH